MRTPPARQRASRLRRRLAVEASFELDNHGKDRTKLDLGSQLTYGNVLALVRTTYILNVQAGSQPLVLN